ncbi:hypothetical protein Tco_0297732, partial [Tanacetum coccineum]
VTNTLLRKESIKAWDQHLKRKLGCIQTGGINAIDADEEITLVSVQNVDEEMFDVNVLDGEEVFVAEQEVVVKDVNNEVNVVKEVVEVFNSAKLITDAAQVSAATTTTATITTVDDITLAQALMEIKST